jgi:hypothetical protein
MKYYSLLLLSLFSSTTFCQISGRYIGVVNNDNVTLILLQNGETISGTMTDSRQSYQVNGKLNANKIDAKAKENTLGITFQLSGYHENGQLYLDADLLLLGTVSRAFSTIFTKEGQVNNKNQNDLSITKPNHPTNSKANLPAALQGKSIDPNLIGTWKQTSSYSSGYGSDFYGSTSSFMAFNSDHTTSDMGSQANISGSNYSGQSGGLSQGRIVPNLWYYTEGKSIMFVFFNNGQYSTHKGGTYHIENGKMLFTQVNTNKNLLYYKQ